MPSTPRSLTLLRNDLAARWASFPDSAGPPILPPACDCSRTRPTRTEARRLKQRLETEFQPFDVVGEGLLLWRYLGGPWEPLGDFPFGGL